MELKFRAWIKTGIETYDYVKPMTIQQLIHSKKSTFSLKQLNDLVDFEQYTGMKDANGKDIYERDVLEYYYETHGQTFYDPDTLGAVGGEPGIETNVIGKVAIWPSTGVVLTRIKAECPEDFDSSNLDVPKMLHVNKHFTIIGNVHENPELLEAQHDTRTDWVS